MSAYLAVSSGTRVIVPATVIVALITAAATLIVGLLNLRIQRSALVTDRFIRAIELLSNTTPEVRIGAIFTLERIASESPPDRPQIVYLLAALVRSQLPISGLKEGEYVSVLRQRAPDAQAALTVLGRRPLSDSRPDPSEIGGLDLTRTDLRRASLKKADLSRADLWRAHLEGADLYDADLRNSNLREANLDSFQPGSPDFRRGTDLRLAKLNGAKLQDARSLDIAVTEGATADGHTIWPGGFDWRAAGVRLVD